MKLHKQFVLCQASLDLDVINWNATSIQNYTLYSDIKIPVTQLKNDSFQLIVLGDVFDYSNYTASNQEIINSLLKINPTNFFTQFDSFCGSFIVFIHFFETNNFFIFHDATGLRQFFYKKNKSNQIIAGSQPTVINNFFPSQKNVSENSILFYKSKQFSRRKIYVGNQTEFKKIKLLTPNHYLNEGTREVIRFFPSKQLSNQNLHLVVKKSAEIIKNYIKAAHYRYGITIPITAGWESRVLLAASKDIKDLATYFVFQHINMSDNHQDIKIPKKLSKKLNFKLKIIKNNATKKHEIPNINQLISFPRHNYHTHWLIEEAFKGTIKANGNVSEIARREWDDLNLTNGKSIATVQQYNGLNYAISYYDKWITKNIPLLKKQKYNYSDILYWEENSANWAGKNNAEFRLVSEVFQPFNSRELLCDLLSVDEKYRKKQDSILYRGIIKELWAECLTEPINPSFKKTVIKILQKIGLYGIYRNISMLIKLLK